MSTPITLKIKAENISRISPAMAAPKSSLAAWTRLGSPAEVVYIKPATTIRRNAIPPAIPMAQPRMNLENSVSLSIAIHPIAVSIPRPPGQPTSSPPANALDKDEANSVNIVETISNPFISKACDSVESET